MKIEEQEAFVCAIMRLHSVILCWMSMAEAGWSRSLLQEYRREDIKAKRWRIKEWDYYLILNDFYGVAFTISDDGYIGLQSVSLLDFKKGWEHTETILNAFPMGKLKLPTSSESGSLPIQG